MDGVGMNECRQLWHDELAVGRCEPRCQAQAVLRGAILGPGAPLASQPQFYEMLRSSSFTRCCTRAGCIARIPAGSLTRCQARAILRGAILGRWCSSAGERRDRSAVNGLDGRWDRVRRWSAAEPKLLGKEAQREERIVANGLDGSRRQSAGS